MDDQNFDDLLNEFFKNRDEKPDEVSLSDILAAVLKNKENELKYNDIIGKIDELGEPDEIEHFTEGEFNVERKTWHKNGETITMTTIREQDEDPLTMETSKFIELLKDADAKDLKTLMAAVLDDEDYEACQLIKEEMDARKKEN